MRTVMELNKNWYFQKENVGLPQELPCDWAKVDLPHTWNAVDGQDGRGEYYRGACWYAKSFETPECMDGYRVYVEVLAAALSGRVYVNGQEVAYHEGGFSTFRADVTEALHAQGENLLVIEVDNGEKSHIYPQVADFTFYGGLYRGVNLILVPEVHFDLDFYGAPGLKVTPVVKGKDAEIKLESWVKNADENYTVRYQIKDADGNVVAESWRPAEQPSVVQFLPDAHLWQGVEDPYLYTCIAELVRRNETVDEVTVRFGIREFYVDKEKGFFLNGKPMKLRGVSRHQDKLYQGNALTKEDHRLDADLIREVGANTIRLAHYQHSQDFYDVCDEYGFVVWAEIPYISSQSDDPAAHENCRQQMKDLIYQNYNHACICFWGISNEITIHGEKPGLVDNHRDLNALVKELDPTRLTTMAHVTLLSQDSDLHSVTDVESYNHYFGWYGGKYEQNSVWFDDYHKKYPDRCIGLSEYGAEGIITYQPDEPKCRDYSEAYQAEYHEFMVKMLMERDYIWSSHVWNMFDFGCAARDEGGVAGRNNKGLVTIDRKIKKEAFYLYKAYWSSEPFVYVCGRRYAQRAGETTTVKVYSNQPAVQLYVDGELFAEQSGEKIFVFEGVPLHEGFTQITARYNDCTDSLALEKVAEKPEIYTLPKNEDEEGMEGAANWFDQAAAEAANAGEMVFPEGYFSIRDKITDIIENDEAAAILSGALSAMSGMKLNKGMLKMLGGKTLEEMIQMVGQMGQEIPEQGVKVLNLQLNKIKK